MSPGRHWPIVVIAALASVLLFTSLDQDYLWSDEGDTAVLARSILLHGVPTAWDGVSFIDSDFGERLTDDFVMVSSPWLQYYVTAASFAVLGETTLAARLPFAIAGLATIVLVYVLILRASENRWTAATGALLLTLSVQFLILSRQSRHYSLNALFTCLLVLQFTRLSSWPRATLFALTGILLFHSHPVAFAPIVALGALTLFTKAFRAERRWFWTSAPFIAIFTVPWLFLAGDGYRQNVGLLNDPSRFLPRLGQALVEYGSVTPAVGILVLLAVYVRTRRRRPVKSAPRFTVNERGLMLTLASVTLILAVALALTQPRDVIWTVGVRYTPAVLPFMAVLAALLIGKVSGNNRRIWAALVLVLGFTRLGRLTPWVFFEEPTARRDASAAVTFHNPERLVDRIFRPGQLGFAQSLLQPNPGTTAKVAEFLNAHAEPDDVVVTNYGWEPLYFHTRLPLGMTVLPTYPIHSAARAKKLPDYVFSAERARWLVWRRAWGAYRGQLIENVLADLYKKKVPVTLVASIPETLWENRENLHFHRFPGNRYIFPWFKSVPDALVFRVGS